MILDAEIAAFAARFGVADSQIVRDHLVSHVLVAVAELIASDDVTFIGGTALCRTWLPDLRLSEDIDLLVDSTSISETLRQHVSRRLRREFPNHRWLTLGSRHDVESWNLVADDAAIVKVQLVRRPEWKAIPVAAADVQLRYSDLPDNVEMMVPTPGGFGAMKLMAWLDRHTSRDLFDLAALADAGHVNQATVDLVKRVAGYAPGRSTLGPLVPRIVAATWPDELGHQVGELGSAEHCLNRVQVALDELTGE